MSRYRWRWPQVQPQVWERLERECGLAPVVARVLSARGFTTPEQVARALALPSADETDPFLFQDMDRAARRLLEGIQRGETIAVYGDYDVDGQTGTALLVAFLRRLGARVTYYVPHRLEEGYGLHVPALQRLHEERQARLVVTVDCGVTAHEAAQEAARLGVDLIITDHHRTAAALPDALAVINPHRPDCPYPYKDLAGVGVAYKLALAVWQRAGSPPEADPAQFLDLVALGTVADVMPLTGENRMLVRQGLDLLTDSPRPGLRALMEHAGLKGPVDSGHLGFVLGPRLNAGGRLHDPLVGVRLLLTAAKAEADELAAQLERLNRWRQSLEGFVTEQARRQVEEGGGAEQAPALVVAGEGWHPGVLGLVASRLVEMYYRPTLVIGVEGDVARGSGRSIEDFDLHAALAACEPLFESFGGHRLAAGFSLSPARIPELKNRFLERAHRELAVPLAAGELLPEVVVDAEVRLEEIDEGLVEQLEALGPFGPGNPAPVLGHRRLRLVEGRAVGAGGQHLQVRLAEAEGGASLRGIGFRMGPWGTQLAPGSWVQAAFTVQVDEWQGRRETKLRLRALEGAAVAGAPVAVAPVAATAAYPALISGNGVAGVSETGVPGDWAVLDRREGTPAYVVETARRALLAEQLEEQGGVAILLVLDEAAREEAVRVWPQGSGRVYAVEQLSSHPRPTAMESPRVHAGEPVHLIVACLPPQRGWLRGWLRNQEWAHKGLRLHLLYGSADQGQTGAWLRRVYPSRDALAQCYRLWRQLLGGAGPGATPDIAGSAEAGLLARIPAATRRAALEIFQELGLVKREGGRWTLTPPPPGSRLDLRNSSYYTRGEEIRRAFQAWAPYALRAAAHEVAAALL